MSKQAEQQMRQRATELRAHDPRWGQSIVRECEAEALALEAVADELRDERTRGSAESRWVTLTRLCVGLFR